MHSFDQAALALNEDWGTHLNDKQIQCWVEAIGRMEVLAHDVEVHAFEQGIRPANAPMLLVMGDGGNWIDPPSKRECLYDQRIVNQYHAVEDLYDPARAALGNDAAEAQAVAGQLKDQLWDWRSG